MATIGTAEINIGPNTKRLYALAQAVELHKEIAGVVNAESVVKTAEQFHGFLKDD